MSLTLSGSRRSRGGFSTCDDTTGEFDADAPQRPSPARRARMSISVSLYTRPGCTFCAVLRWQLRRLDLPVNEIDIWRDRDAAARVRAATGGDETVPTVVVGEATLVAPGVDQVCRALREVAPDHVIDSSRSLPVRVARGLVGPVLVLAVWVALGLLAGPASIAGLGPGVLAASWAVAARVDAARSIGFGLGGALAGAGAALAVGALPVVPVLGATVASVPAAVIAVAVGSAFGVIIAGRTDLQPPA